MACSDRASGIPAMRGFTLIETVVASLLAVVMMAIVAGLIPALQSRNVAARREVNDRPWQNVLARQLQSEFLHCQSLVVERNRIRMDSLESVHPSSGKKLHEPCTIQYRISGSQPAFVIRTVKRALARADDPENIRLVAWGVTQFELLTRLDTDIPPGVVRLRIHFVDLMESGRTGSFDVVLFRHGAVGQ